MSLQLVDARTAADVPADLLTPQEAEALTKLARHLTDTSITEISAKSQRAVALALAAIAQSAAEGNSLSTQALDLLKADKVDVAVEALRVDATTKSQAAEHPAAEENARDAITEAATAWRVLGAVAYLLDRKQGLAAYEKAVVLDPRDAFSQFWIGDIAVASPSNDKAKPALERALLLASTDPTGLVDVWARQQLGYIAVWAGDSDAALLAYREVRAIVDRHLAADPRSAIWRYELYRAMLALTAARAQRDEFDAAARAVSDELAIIGSLVAADKDNDLWRHELMLVYGDIGQSQNALGHKLESLRAYETALGIAEQRVRQLPGNSGRSSDLGSAYENLGVAQGNGPNAAVTLSKAIALAEHAAAADPGNIDRQSDRSGLYEKLGTVQLAMGDRESAENSYIADFNLAGQLQSLDPSRLKTWRRRLVEMLNKIGPLQEQRKAFEQALASYRGALSVARPLAAEDPSALWLQQALVFANGGIGDVSYKRGRLADALDAYREAIAICARFAKTHPDDDEVRATMAMRLESAGDIQFELNDFSGAQASYRRAVDLEDALSREHPGDRIMREDLASLYNRVGDAQRKDKDFDGAATSKRTAQAILLDLLKAAPRTTRWQSDLAASYSVLGVIEVERGNLDAGLAVAMQSQVVLSDLAEAHPDDLTVLRDLAVAYGNIAGCLVRKGERDKALAYLKQGQLIIKSLAAIASDNAGLRSDLDHFERAIGNLGQPKKQGNI